MANRRFGAYRCSATIILPPGQRATISRRARRTRRHLVLQGSEVVQNGKIKATWFVVPWSGTTVFRDCATNGAAKATSEKAATRPWTPGSNDAVNERSTNEIISLVIWGKDAKSSCQGDGRCA